NSYANVKLGIISQFLANFQRAQNRRFRTISKNKCATVASRQTKQFAFRFSEPELLGAAHDFLQLLNLVSLLVDHQLRVTDDVDEEDVADFKLNVRLRTSAHITSVPGKSRSSFFRGKNLLNERFKAGITPQRIKERIDFDEGNAVSVAVFVGLFEEINGLILLSKTNVDHREKIR